MFRIYKRIRRPWLRHCRQLKQYSKWPQGMGQ